MLFPEIEDGMDTEEFTHIPSISCYNSNYYEYKSHLIYWESDDDNTTDWFLVKQKYFYYLGQSYCSEEEKMNRMEERPT